MQPSLQLTVLWVEVIDHYHRLLHLYLRLLIVLLLRNHRVFGFSQPSLIKGNT